MYIEPNFTILSFCSLRVFWYLTYKQNLKHSVQSSKEGLDLPRCSIIDNCLKSNWITKIKQSSTQENLKTRERGNKIWWGIIGKLTVVLEDLIWRRTSLKSWSLEALFKLPWWLTGRHKPVPSSPFFSLSSIFFWLRRLLLPNFE